MSHIKTGSLLELRSSESDRTIQRSHMHLYLVTLVAPGNPPITVKGIMTGIDQYEVQNRFKEIKRLTLQVKELAELRTLQEGHLVPLE